MGRAIPRVLAVTAILAWLVGAQAPFARAADVTLEVTPPSVKLAPGERADVIAVLRNASSTSLNDLVLTWPTESGITVASDNNVANSVPAGGSLAWNVHVTRLVDEEGPLSVPLRVDYQTSSSTKTAIPGVATALLTVEGQAPIVASSLADLTLKTSLIDLKGGRQGIMYVLLRNVSAIPLSISSVTLLTPSFVVPCREEGANCLAGETLGASGSDRRYTFGLDRILPAQAAGIYPFVLQAAQAVEPGPHLVVVTADLSWLQAGHTQTGAVTATNQFTSSVLGESEIVALLGIPSLLFLPGFLVVITFRLLWSLSPGGEFSFLKLNSIQFWFITISASLVIVLLLYPLLPGGTALGLGTYSLADIAYIWLSSILLGGAAYGLERLRRVAHAFWHSRKYPAKGDDALVVLEKLARSHRSLLLPHVRFKSEHTSSQAFLLPTDPRDHISLVAPPIVFDEIPLGLTSYRLYLDELERALSGNDARSAVQLLLTPGRAVATSSVRWKGVGGLAGVAEAKGELVYDDPVPRRIIQRGVISHDSK